MRRRLIIIVPVLLLIAIIALTFVMLSTNRATSAAKNAFDYPDNIVAEDSYYAKVHVGNIAANKISGMLDFTGGITLWAIDAPAPSTLTVTCSNQIEHGAIKLVLCKPDGSYEVLVTQTSASDLKNKNFTVTANMQEGYHAVKIIGKKDTKLNYRCSFAVTPIEPETVNE